MTSMVRLLRTLELLEGLDGAIPESVRLPIARARTRAASHAATRPRAARGRARPALGLGRRAPRRPDDRRPSDALGTRVAAVSIDERRALRDVPVRPGVRAQRNRDRARPHAAAGAPLRLPGTAAGRVRRAPGLLADSLPDRWGTALVNAWLAAQGRQESGFDVVQRLCYVGTRGAGALEFQPAHEPAAPPDAALQVEALVRLASEVLTDREGFVTELRQNPDEEAMKAILAVGSSAGGARPKAFIAYNEVNGQVRSGQVDGRRGLQAVGAQVRRRTQRRRPRAAPIPKGGVRSSTPTRGWRGRPASR